MDEPDDNNGMLKSPHYILLFGIGYVLFVALYFMQRLCSRRNHSEESFSSQQIRCFQLPWRQSDNALDEITFDDRNYQLWNTEQVIDWARCTLSSELNPSVQLSSHRRHLRRPRHALWGVRKTISALRDQCIDGSSLEHLTLQHLLSFGIPFGLAVHLSTAIEELISISHHSTSRGASTRSRLRSDLVSLPSWYEQDNQTSNGAASSAINNEIDVEMQENVQQIMQERFGMSLPALGGTNSQSQPTTNSNIEPMGKMEPAELAQIMQMNHNVKQQDNSTSQNGTSAHIDGILNNMPPQIRAIAERRPDLVSKLLSDVRSINNTHSLESISEEQHVFAELNEEQQYDEEVSYDTEMVGLLRRRTNNSR
jgi:hypothetical protein